MIPVATPPEKADSADTFIEERSGRWYVSIAVVFDDGVVRKEINSYRTEREAEIAARYIKRAANRDLNLAWGSDVVGDQPGGAIDGDHADD